MIPEERILSGIRKVKEQFPLATFYVFGSRARGDARPDSDLDVYVVVPELLEDPFELLYRLRRSLHAEIDLPLDVLLCDEARFRGRSGINWTMEHTVAREGVAV